jgi:hypothetical protein
LAFTAPSLAFVRCRMRPRGLSTLTTPSAEAAGRSTMVFLDPGSSSRPCTPPNAEASVERTPRFSGFPSADLSVRVNSRCRVRRHTTIGPPLPPDGSGSALVILRHFDGLLRERGAGLLHPAAGYGVRWVSLARLRTPKSGVDGLVLASHTPLEEYSSSIAVPHHCGSIPS